ncbi:B-box zinc finger protein [Pleionea sp. CnH1-48]|uniref:B-box zinc finger protein n=1 Tax=Pleionea sp. CnH1-48 TaxID=2954494 RepID=UPI002096CEA9|nr:B-box zinc finger protein [Pleionea sp. CnH1-48]MCO7226390.1 hypothetical protein [Pleionea sp. CnH1-48]
MEDLKCKYHPDASASWYCGRCDVPFCMSCVPENKKHHTPRCTLCRNDLELLGIRDVITPFWFKLGHFFFYPFHTTLLTFNIIMTVLFMLIPDFLFAPVIQLLWLAYLVKVGFAVMEYTASGHLDVVEWKKITAINTNSAFLKLMIVYLIMGLVLWKISAYSNVLAIITGIFFILGYPATNIILCIDRSILRAVNPLRIIHIMLSIGGSYWILFLLLLLLNTSLFYGIELIDSNLSSLVSDPLLIFFLIYVSLVTFRMFGYVIYQYHFELDFSVHRDSLHQNIRSHGRHTSELMDEQQELNEQSGGVTEAEICIQEGRYAEAESLLRQAIEEDVQDKQAYDLLYKLYQLQGKTKSYTSLALQHLDALATRNALPQMREVFLKAQGVDSGFVPKHPKIIHLLIRSLSKKDDVKLCYALMNHLKKHYIDYPGLADACFTCAKLITEKLNRREEAAKIIRWALNVAKGDLKTTMEGYLKLL